MDAYYDCYQKYNNEYDWLSFFDLDEDDEKEKEESQNFIKKKRIKSRKENKDNIIMIVMKNIIKNMIGYLFLI